MYEIWVIDEDSKRKVYVGAQEDEPADRIHMANFFIDVDGKKRRTHLREYKISDRSNGVYLYKELTPLS